MEKEVNDVKEEVFYFRWMKNYNFGLMTFEIYLKVEELKDRRMMFNIKNTECL